MPDSLNSSGVGRQGVLFDVDGVLVDSPPVHVRSWEHVLAPLGISVTAEWLYRQEGRRAAEVARAILEEHGIQMDGAEFELMIQRKRSYYRRHAPQGLRPDAAQALAELRNRGWRMGLVSGSSLMSIEAAIGEAERRWFEVLVTAESYRKGKPDPEPYLVACRRLDVMPEQCVAVENAPLGIQAAKRAGLTVVALTSTLPASQLQGADYIIDSLTHLPPVIEKLVPTSV